LVVDGISTFGSIGRSSGPWMTVAVPFASTFTAGAAGAAWAGFPSAAGAGVAASVGLLGSPAFAAGASVGLAAGAGGALGAQAVNAPTAANPPATDTTLKNSRRRIKRFFIRTVRPPSQTLPT
jgi:hypothetical protein